MKLQVLNGSFSKVLAAAATIAFTISLASPAQAQGQWGADRCYYATQNGQMVRQGCMVTGNLYRDYTNVITDLQTGWQFFQGQDGRMLIKTASGWVDAQAYVAQVRANRANPYFAATYGAGTVGGGLSAGAVSPGVATYGAGIVGGAGAASENVSPGVAAAQAALRASQQRQTEMWLAPNCTSSYNGCR